MKNKYTVEGMTCSACSAAVNRTVQKIQGVKDVNVNLLTKSMTVELDENIDNLNIDEKIIEAKQCRLQCIGFPEEKARKRGNWCQSCQGRTKGNEEQGNLVLVFLVPLCMCLWGI